MKQTGREGHIAGRGAARIFLRGFEVMKAKSLEKEKLLVSTTAKEST